jgi:hypothetical protein
MRPLGDPPPFAAQGNLKAARITANYQGVHDAVLLNRDVAHAASLDTLGVKPLDLLELAANRLRRMTLQLP